MPSHRQRRQAKDDPRGSATTPARLTSAETVSVWTRRTRVALGLAAAAAISLLGRAAPAPAVTQAPVELVVSAAASLTDVMQALGAAFEQVHPGVRIRYNFGPSGGLARQIEQGAPVDVFVSVSQAVTEGLVQAGFIDPASVRTMATNTVVLVVPSGTGVRSVSAWKDLARPDVKRLALGDPAYVPAGEYGKQVLQHLALWEAVQSKLVFGMDVRQVLHYVALGEVDAGVVYATDAAIEKRVRVVDRAPAGSHKPVVYPVGVLTRAPHAEQARRFAEFLFTEEARAILQRYGFEPSSP